MSEEFDREAEKEQLRQQLEAEESARRSTEHLSELLLKGATMTNRHCDECGDPIFRYDGREFCPTCQREVGGNGQPIATDVEDGEAEASAGQDGTGAGASGVESPTAPTHQPSSDATATDAPVDGADLGAARAALARKLTALATEAEATSDVRRARSLLVATREAADALQAVDDLDR